MTELFAALLVDRSTFTDPRALLAVFDLARHNLGLAADERGVELEPAKGRLLAAFPPSDEVANVLRENEIEVVLPVIDTWREGDPIAQVVMTAQTTTRSSSS